MSKYKDLVYYVLDQAKLMSDDSYFTEDHVIFLLNKFRAQVLKEEKEKKEANGLYDENEDLDSNSQTIDVYTSNKSQILNMGKGPYLVSDKEIPDMLFGYRVYLPADYFGGGEISIVSSRKFKYVGYNPYLKNIIYCTIGPDKKLYMRSPNPQFKYIEHVQLRATFEDPTEADEMIDGLDTTDDLECDFPMQEGLISRVIELTMRHLLGAAYRPQDMINNANDDLSDLAAWARRNMKSELSKQIDGNQ